ncbi:membrane-associated tyrosine- and threonine-specific cdc2-inhibitory kinase isoform X2 [Ischnura elegans]|uniref:membrane-associated tyrosine- and threonine-specific cdc2-inhibitory kinase isoform X2 n=1 Tax=Ischnura elegans TaxID=197161 RepID=UPI001ED876C2|nr:membrane-associated tyrosine- and threonine-specific cdc2-inhibitory kinase isoform X2 [Ischnura elegans]
MVKEDSVLPERKPMPGRPRKSNSTWTSAAGAQAISLLGAENSLCQFYDKDSNVSYLEQCFEIVGCIGHGCFGVVFKANSLEDGKLYAIKKSRDRFRNALDKKRKLVEVELLEKLPKHPNCIQMHRAWEENGFLFLQLELCEISLAKYTLSHHRIPEEMIWNILTDMVLALKHLHDRNIMHLDIKLDNILISSNGSFKLSDFGISLDCSQKLRDIIDGDAKYIAPEVLTESFSKAADIFSLGISIYEVSYDVNLPQCGVQWQRLRKGQIPQLRVNSISKDLFELIKWMMDPDPEKRPTVDMILQHSQIRRILLKRKINQLLETLASSGKLFMSFLTFFGKVGYDMLMAALVKLRPMNQGCPALVPDALDILDEHPRNISENKHVVTSTPMKHSEENRMTPERVNESWEISECFDSSAEVCRNAMIEDSPSGIFFKNIPSESECKHCRTVRVHPYSNSTRKKCIYCFRKRCSTVRNLLNDFP